MAEVATRRVLIVLPALNEEQNVAAVVTHVRETLPEAGVLVVDDGSSDATSLRAREAGATVARLAVNLGVGGAMRTGYRYAVANGYDVVVQVDADGQHDPDQVRELIDGLDSADVVIGARFAGRGDYKAGGPRRWAMVVLAFVISRLARTKLTDVTSGFKAAGPRAVKMFAQYYPAEYLGDTIESLVLAIRGGLVVRQIPVAMRERSGGTPSQTPIRAAVYLARAGLALLLALVRRRPSVESADAA
ncbi:glycosyltransferase family 2 protein [Actinokineospora auranticolor]|uniref:Glycosyltransferase involved in cell wall biosynthesis n=1 Tax=Actinokineospora auranticolor TaxID=155976 RepID=A0A2S6GLA2_9PSEU|nr:glycosyltransferase family 2 protein [Actinokineospora auranticolor]PPK65953.1 glycosyltransferase involved in cell wall biosynthesis [Actinokineospora auranticolor]